MKIDINDILYYLKDKNIKYNYFGKNNISVNGYSSLNNIKNNCITWIKDQSFYEEELLIGLKDVIFIVHTDVKFEQTDNKDISFIVCENPKEVFFSTLNEFFLQKEFKNFISTNSIIETKIVGKDVYIGHNCYIGESVIIGDNVVIKNNVSIEGEVEIGNNSILNSGVVIGTDGFGYFQNDQAINVKVPHYGGVRIGENVEIGANTCIDRGTLEDTIIGNNVKIDNLKQIAHNVIIEDNCIILSNIPGSVILKKNSYIAPGSTIKNHIIIGENSLVGMGVLITENIAKNSIVARSIKKNRVITGVSTNIIKKSLGQI